MLTVMWWILPSFMMPQWSPWQSHHPRPRPSVRPWESGVGREGRGTVGRFPGLWLPAFGACKKTSEFLKKPGDFFEKNTSKAGFFIKGFSHLKKDVDVPVTLTGWMSLPPIFSRWWQLRCFCWSFHPENLGKVTFAYFSDGLVKPPTRTKWTLWGWLFFLGGGVRGGWNLLLFSEMWGFFCEKENMIFFWSRH